MASELPVVRTVTAFVSPRGTKDVPHLCRSAGAALAAALAALAAEGFEVQTVRVALSPFESWLEAGDDAGGPLGERLVAAATEALGAADAGFSGAGGKGPAMLLTVGPATTPRGADAIPALVRAVPRVTASLDLGRAPPAGGGAGAGVPSALAAVCPAADPAMSAAAARVMARLARTTPDAAGNFCFAALARMPPCVPFFPAAFAPPPPSGAAEDVPLRLAVGMQHLNVTVPAAEARAAELAARAPGGGAQPLASEIAAAAAAALLPHARRVQAIMEAACEGPAAAAAAAAAPEGAAAFSVTFAGLDSSFAPNPGAPSLDRLFRAAGVPYPGAPGSVALASALTAACKTLGCPASSRPLLVGYCGLMLPPLEDLGLAAAVDAGRLTVPALLSVSSVCGIGLDTVPVHVPGLFPGDGGAAGPADEDEDAVAAPLRRTIDDVAALAYRLGKPLSCRLFPYPARPGEPTAFDHPHMCNTAVMTL